MGAEAQTGVGKKMLSVPKERRGTPSWDVGLPQWGKQMMA